MIDLMKRLAELDAQNPNIVKEQPVTENLDECGMMGGMSQPHMPASINMTADSGAELTGMLKDIMQLAGQPMQEPMGGEEPLSVSLPAASTSLEPVDSEPDSSMSPADSMRSVIDKLNPMDQDSEDDGEEDDQEKVNEYDNEPNPQGTGYGSMTPTGDDLASKGDEAPKVNGGGNPMQKTMEQITTDLFADYQKFISEN